MRRSRRGRFGERRVLRLVDMTTTGIEDPRFARSDGGDEISRSADVHLKRPGGVSLDGLRRHQCRQMDDSVEAVRMQPGSQVFAFADVAAETVMVMPRSRQLRFQDST